MEKTFEERKEYAKAYSFWACQYEARNPEVKKSWQRIKNGLKRCPEWIQVESSHDHWSPFLLEEISEEHLVEKRRRGGKSQPLYDIMTDFHRTIHQHRFYPDVGAMNADKIVSLLVANKSLPKTESFNPPNLAIINPDNVFTSPQIIDGKRAINLSIDLDAPMEAVLKEIELAVIAADTYSTALDISQDQYFALTETYLEVEIESLRIFHGKGQKGFKQSSNNSRALGLWLWDYIELTGDHSKRGILAEAIRAMKQKIGKEVITLGYSASEGRVFRNFYLKTKECIERCEVLSFS